MYFQSIYVKKKFKWVWCSMWSDIMDRGSLLLLQNNWIKIREDKNRITLIIVTAELYFALLGGIISLQKHIEQFVKH